MTTTPQSPHTPPQRAQAVLRAALPNDSLRDAIVGDLHEEFVTDAAQFGAARARGRYRWRAAGVVAHAMVDALLWRGWASTPAAGEAPIAAAVQRVPVAYPRGRVGGADIGLGAIAFGVLLVGIVINTVLFTTVRDAPRATAPVSAIGIGATVLAIVCAGVAAVVLCVGPRWLRKRLHRNDPPCESGDGV